MLPSHLFLFFFLNDPAPPEISTLPLHAALPISLWSDPVIPRFTAGKRLSEEEVWARLLRYVGHWAWLGFGYRSEEHTSELQSQSNLVCRLLLEKKKNKNSVM